MTGSALKAAFVLWLMVVGLSDAFAQQPSARIMSIRFGTEGGATRVVIETDTALSPHTFLSASGRQQVVIEFPRLRWFFDGRASEGGSGAGGGLVQSFRYTHPTATSSRVVLELSGPARLTRAFSLPGRGQGQAHRIVLDLDPAVSSAAYGASPADAGLASPVVGQVARKPLIVIDPGHGGRDPGALSAGGIREKDVTLAAAQQLREKLLETGRYDVALTRTGDVFLELDARVTKARNLGADLFIAIHADAGARPDTRGASVYTLSPDGEKRVDNAARQHDWMLDVEVDSNRPDEVNQILRDLVQRETKNQSSRFAELLTEELSRSGWPTLENTHRRKSLYVLLSPDTPAALLEMGFLTSPEDVAALTSSTRRAQLITTVSAAIDRYFASQALVMAGR